MKGGFRTFPRVKKSAKVGARSSSELAAHSSSSTPGAHGVVSSLEEPVQSVKKEEHQVSPLPDSIEWVELCDAKGRTHFWKGFFALFPKIKKVQSWLRIRGRNCSPSRAHPRKLLNWRTPSSGCGSGMTTLAILTTGTDAPKRLPGSHRLASRWCGSAKGMRRDLSGTGTGEGVPVATLFLLFLLSEAHRGALTAR